MKPVCPQCGHESKADRVSLWAMFDDHTFKRYSAKSVDDFIEKWRADLKNEDSALCPVIVMAGAVEMRRIGKMVHPDWGKGAPRDESAVAEFREAVLADPDIARIMSQSS
jgi:hypothetical protein